MTKYLVSRLVKLRGEYVHDSTHDNLDDALARARALLLEGAPAVDIERIEV